GKDTSEEFISWLDAFIKERSISRDEFREVLSRLDAIENSLDHVKEEQGRQRAELNQLRSEMTERFDRINERFDKMTERFDRMNERFDRMNERLQSSLKWTVGVVMGMGSLLAILMSIYKFMG
ncbi:MAG: hypothetical protein DRG39_02660, partial [Deltaproteobacteria bacterium]